MGRASSSTNDIPARTWTLSALFTFIVFLSLSLRAHYSFPFTAPCTLTFSFFVPRPLPFPPIPSVSHFETVRDFYDRDRCYTKRKKSDASEERLEGDGTRRSQGIRGIRMVGMIAVRDERTTTTVAVVRAWNCNYTARTRAHHRISHGRF